MVQQTTLIIVSQLSKCLKFVTFRGVILYRIQSFLSPRTDLNFRHLLSCDTIVSLYTKRGVENVNEVDKEAQGYQEHSQVP